MADKTFQTDKTPPTLRQRKLTISANVLVQILAAGALLVMINWLASRHYLRFDWTKTRYYAISEKTKQVLGALTEPVDVVVFLQPHAEAEHIGKVYQDVRDLLKEFEFFAKKKLRVEYVDPERDRVRAEQLFDRYKVGTANVVIFVCGERNKYVALEELVDFDYSQMGMGYRIKAFKGESAFLSAIQTVTEEKPPVVYFLTGHGERNFDNYDQQEGYSGIGQYIKRDNLKVEKWNLTEQQQMPADIAALVIAGPQKRLTDTELQLIDDYLRKNGGRVFILLEPRHETGLEAYLAQWGVQVDNNLVVMKGGSLFGTDLMVVNALGSSYATHPITRRLEGVNTMFPYSRTVRRASGNISSDGPSPLVVELVKTPAAFWGETDLQSRRMKFDPQEDMAGPLSLAVAVEASKPSGVDLEGREYRLVVVGSASFVDNSGLSGGNVDFFMNSLNWLLRREKLVAVSPKLPQEFRLDMSPRQLRAVYLFAVAGLPLAVAVLGMLVWVRRRK